MDNLHRILSWNIQGGEGGRQVVAVGTPEEIAALEANDTGRFLRAVL